MEEAISLPNAKSPMRKTAIRLCEVCDLRWIHRMTIRAWGSLGTTLKFPVRTNVRVVAEAEVRNTMSVGFDLWRPTWSMRGIQM